MSKESIEIANLMLSKDPESHALADALLIGQTAGLSELEIKTLCVDICDHFFRAVGVDKFLTNIVQNAQKENDRELFFPMYSNYIYIPFDCTYCYTAEQHSFFYGCMEATIRFRFSKRRKFERLTISQKHAFFRTNLKHQTNIKGFTVGGFGVYLRERKAKTLRKVQQFFPVFIERQAKKLQEYVSNIAAFDVGQYVKIKGLANAPAWEVIKIYPKCGDLVAATISQCNGQIIKETFEYSEVELTDAPTANYQ